jgi:hypothetical protein
VGKVKTKDDKVVFEDIDKEIEEAKEVKKKEEKPKKVKEEIDINKLRKDLDKLGDWIADVDDDLKSLEDLVDRIAKRMGME